MNELITKILEFILIVVIHLFVAIITFGPIIYIANKVWEYFNLDYKSIYFENKKKRKDNKKVQNKKKNK